jgi:hypothetical protein
MAERFDEARTKYRENEVHTDINRARLVWRLRAGHIAALGKEVTEVWSIDNMGLFSIRDSQRLGELCRRHPQLSGQGTALMQKTRRALRRIAAQSTLLRRAVTSRLP